MEVKEIIEQIEDLNNCGLSTSELLQACQIGVLTEIADELVKFNSLSKHYFNIFKPGTKTESDPVTEIDMRNCKDLDPAHETKAQNLPAKQAHKVTS